MKKIKILISLFLIVAMTITSTVAVSAITYGEQTGIVKTTNNASASTKFNATPTQCTAGISVTAAPANSSVTVSGTLYGEYIITLSTGETYTDSTSDSRSSGSSTSLVIYCPSNARWSSLNATLTLTCNGISNSSTFYA